jgi:hypothetical protein
MDSGELWRNPGYFPKKLDQSGFTENPGGVNPFPMPKNVGVGLYTGTPTRLHFTATGVTPPYVSQAPWYSPLFDLQPWFRAEQTGQQDGTPIWRGGQGAGGRLWVDATNLSPVFVGGSYFSQVANLRVTAVEWGHVANYKDVQPIGPEIDITSEFVGGGPTRILQFLPTGEGYPMRYYQVKLLFRYFIRPGNVTTSDFASPIHLMPSYY